jgi:FHA domain-containing protein
LVAELETQASGRDEPAPYPGRFLHQAVLGLGSGIAHEEVYERSLLGSSLLNSGHAISITFQELRAREGLNSPRTVFADTPRLRIEDADGEREFLLGQFTSIGRAPRNQVRLACESASRKHCQIERSEDGRYWLTDLCSGNGTWIRGEQLDRSRPLEDGDPIRVGNALLTFMAPAPQPWVNQRVSPPWLLQAPTSAQLAEERDPNWIEAWLAESQSAAPSRSTTSQAVAPRIRIKSQERVCPLCREDARSEACGRCVECETVYHRSCYLELGGCSTLGCSEQGRSPEVQSPTWDSQTLGTVLKWFLLLVLALVVGSLLWPISPAVATAVRVVIPAAALGVAYGELKQRLEPLHFTPTTLPLA